MTKELQTLVEIARKVVMTEGEREEQRRSFAFGNTNFENPDITRAMIDAQAEKLKRESQNERR